MRSSKEIREEAWALLWKNNHIWKLFGVGVLQAIIYFGVVGTLFWLVGFNKNAESLIQIVGNLFQAVIALGLCAALLGVARGEEGAILSDSFLGYKYPFRAFFAQLVAGFVILAWMFVPIVILVGILTMIAHDGGEITPAMIGVAGLAYLIAFIIVLTVSYRYRQLWFIKADDPSSGAFAALKRSVKMMDGHKWQLFKLDMSYWLAALWIFVPIVGWIIFANYLALGSAIFYRDLLVAKDDPTTVDLDL